MTALTKFDTVLTKVIGKLPKGLHPFFDGLGYITMPAVWFIAMGAWVVFRTLAGESIITELVVLAGIPVATVLKLFIRRQRPMTIYAEAMKVKSYSFPSSHAYSAALVCGYFSNLTFSSGLDAVAIGLMGLATLIGISRVHLGAHYPSDVVAGWLLGAGLVYAAIQL
jgi:undecaprenyl-diphosphatase